jgi:hypothetical protein
VRAERSLFDSTIPGYELSTLVAAREEDDGVHDARTFSGPSFDEAALTEELESVSPSDPLVRSLWNLRNDVISHTAADLVRRGDAKAARSWLPEDQIEELLNRAKAITAKYSVLFQGRISGGIAGHDDYKRMLLLVRKGLSADR